VTRTNATCSTSRRSYCPGCKRAYQQRYCGSDKGKARGARYRATEKYRAKDDRYEASRLRIQIAGLRYTYRVRPERQDELSERLAAFRADQAEQYRDAAAKSF
jgi:hypothetical protein